MTPLEPHRTEIPDTMPSPAPAAERDPFQTSPELGRLLADLANAEQTRRDRLREQELARLRTIQQFD